MTEQITLDEAVKRIKETNGKIFGLLFQKRDGEMRKMAARLGVRKGVTGQGLAYDPAEKGLLGVYDVQKGKGFRMVNLAGLKEVTIDKQVFGVKQ